MSLKTKIIFSFIAVILTTSLFSAVVGIKNIDKSIVPRIQEKVRYDLNSVNELFNGEISNVNDIIRLTSTRFFITESIKNDEIRRLNEELQNIRKRESLDILNLTDAKGRILVRTNNPESIGDDKSSLPIVTSVLKTASPIAAVEIIRRESLSIEGLDIQKRAQFPIINTSQTESHADITEETSGMFILASSPILDKQNRILGIIYGGRLLNNDTAIVDKIKDTMYSSETYRRKDVGAVTLFLNNVRISTTVKNGDGMRAIGTLIAQEVYDRVVVDGEILNKVEFAVNDWYITAYEPIVNSTGQIIGILGVGVLESKYKEMEHKALLIFIGITLIGSLLAVAIGLFLTNSIMHPIDVIYKGTQKLADGDLSFRIDLKDMPNEIATLGNAFNFMASSIKERDEKLLKYTQDEIMKSERLAMIGRLAANVAHEINNPLGGILLFSGLLLKKAPPNEKFHENLERIEREAKRCQIIVQGLLDFARESEPKKEIIDVNEVVEKTIMLFTNQPMFQNIEVFKNYQPDISPVFADPAQIQQVFVNIILNAVDAMEKKGVLTITTRNVHENDVVEIHIADTGVGMSKEQIDNIFEPFYTTKCVGYGSGLGLSISFGIIQGHEGSIKVVSAINKGSTFIIQLPKRKDT